MISKKELIKEQKDCADMLGMSLSEYQRSLRETKVNLNVILIMCRIVESKLGDSYN